MKKGKGSFIKGCKERGEWAELCFMARAVQHGFSVSRPYGDSSAYDVGVEDNGRFSRVQVKSVTFFRGKSYTCNVVGPKHERYQSGRLEFFAVYLVPIDLWYVIPFEVVKNNLSLNLAPHLRGHKFAQYMEAWHLMSGDGSRAKAREE